MGGEFLLLGTGASAGVPVVGCRCKICMSQESKNHRMRPAGVLSWKGKKILIDAGPDFRMQALRFDLHDIDALFLTHMHYDHIGGFDDLRVFYFFHKKILPCFLSQLTYEELKKRCYYFFQGIGDEVLANRFSFYFMGDTHGSIDVKDLSFSYINYAQQGVLVNGMRVESFAYMPDIREYEESIFDALQGVETLVLGALRAEPSAAHFTIDEAIAFATRVGAKRLFLTHLCHEIDHEQVQRALPRGVYLAYDGLRIRF